MHSHDYEVVQIVDALPRDEDEHRPTIDPDDMAKGLSLLIKPFGGKSQKIALVANDDERSYTAYTGAGYDTRKIAGNRAAELRRFIRETIEDTEKAPPKRMVVVSEDPQFAFLCETIANHTQTELKVWASGKTAPTDLREPKYGFCALEELLPYLKVARIDVRIDLENILIGLVNRGWQPNIPHLIGAIRQAVQKPGRGNVVAVTAYADFEQLNRHHGSPNANWQRELTMADCESRYVINQHGKNSADMRIAGDIRTVLEQDSNTASAIDVIALVTMDRDFAHVIKDVKLRGKKAIIIGLQDGLSSHLRNLTEVCYLDEYLKLPQPGKQETQRNMPPPSREDAALMMRIGAWMNRNRWRFVFRDKLEQEFSEQSESLRKLIADGWFAPSRNSSFDTQGQARSLQPNPDHTGARAAQFLAYWIPGRVDHCLNQKCMPYVDSSFLAKGMAFDRKLAEIGVGQTRPDAEGWLQVAASAGLVVAEEMEHPQRPGKFITTWRRPEPAAVESAIPVVETESNGAPVAQVVNIRQAASQPELAHLRNLLTRGLDDNDLNGLLLDHFTDVYRRVESNSLKVAKIQALLDYTELHHASDKLLAAIREKNPSLFEPPVAVPEAA